MIDADTLLDDEDFLKPDPNTLKSTYVYMYMHCVASAFFNIQRTVPVKKIFFKLV